MTIPVAMVYDALFQGVSFSAVYIAGSALVLSGFVLVNVAFHCTPTDTISNTSARSPTTTTTTTTTTTAEADFVAHAHAAAASLLDDGDGVDHNVGNDADPLFAPVTALFSTPDADRGRFQRIPQESPSHLDEHAERRRSSAPLSDRYIDDDVGDVDDDHHGMHLRDRFPHGSHAVAAVAAVELTTIATAPPPFHHHASDADLIGPPPR